MDPLGYLLKHEAQISRFETQYGLV
jgi:hypothetical protein